jgi:hypothetical protein
MISALTNNRTAVLLCAIFHILAGNAWAGNNWYLGKDCLSKEGQEYVHRLLADCKENFGGRNNGDCPPEMIADIVEEAMQNSKFLKNGAVAKCARKAARAGRHAKRVLGPFGFVIGVMYFASDARAEGVCMATCRATPGVDVVVDGWETFPKVADEINGYLEDVGNDPVKFAHVLAGYFTQLLAPGLLGDLSNKDGEAVASCIQAMYDQLQSSFMRILAAQNTGITNQFDFSFINDSNVIGPIISRAVDSMKSCLDDAELPPVICPLPPPPPTCCCVSCTEQNCPNCEY